MYSPKIAAAATVLLGLVPAIPAWNLNLNPGGGSLHNAHVWRTQYQGCQDKRLMRCSHRCEMKGHRYIRSGGHTCERQLNRPDSRPTCLRAIHLGVDNHAPHETREAHPAVPIPAVTKKLASEKKVSPKGWDYWGYRAILLLVAAIWGTNFPVVKLIESHPEISNATATFTRFAIAALALSPLTDWRETEVILAGMEIGIFVAMGYLTQAIGLATTDASVCAFLCSLTVVFVPLIESFSGKALKPITFVAAGLALLGTGFLELGGAAPSINDLWCVAQAVGFGVAFTRIEHYMEKFPGKSLQLSIGQLFSVALLTGIWCIQSSWGHIPDFSFLQDKTIAVALGYTSLVTTSLAVWLETVALEAVPASEMSVIFSTEPLWASAISKIFLKETLGKNAVIGAIFIFGACLTAQAPQVLQMLGLGKGGEGGSSPVGVDATLLNEEDVSDYPLPQKDDVVG
ncbi:unnamed protein product [Choristocarpus tenellus]